MLVTIRGAEARASRGLGWGLFAGGIACLLLTGVMNWFQGDAMGVTVPGKILSSLSSVVVDVVGLVLFGMAAGACWAARRWIPAGLFTLVMIASALWSTTAMISFQATERISAAASREKQLSRRDELDAYAKGFVTWLRGQSINADSRSARKDFLGAASTEVGKLRDVQVQSFMLPDAGAQVLADWTGWKVQRVQITLVSYLAMLLILLQAMCFPASAFFLNPLATSSAEKGKGNLSGGGGGGKMPAQPKKEEPAPAPAAAASLRIVASGPDQRQPLDAFLQEQLSRGKKFESQRQIARQSGWSEPTVSKVLKKLSQQGKLSRNQGDGKAKTVRRQRVGDGGSRHAVLA